MFKTFGKSRLLSIIYLFLVFALLTGSITAQQRQSQPPQAPVQKESDLLKPLQWRSIGPFRGGRATAVAGVASQPAVFYFGVTGGGVREKPPSRRARG